MKHQNNQLDSQQKLLIQLVEQSPEDWTMRKRVIDLLYSSCYYSEAAEILADAPTVPTGGDEQLYMAKIYSRTQPGRAVEVVDGLIKNGSGDPKAILEMAQLMAQIGMPLQAIRFYGAVTAMQPDLSDCDFEQYLLEADESKENWADAVCHKDFPWYDESQESLTNQEANSVQSQREVEVKEPEVSQPVAEEPVAAPVLEPQPQPLPPVVPAPEVVSAPVPEAAPPAATPAPQVIQMADTTPTAPLAVVEPELIDPRLEEAAPQPTGFFKSYDDAHGGSTENTPLDQPAPTEPIAALEAPVDLETPEPTPTPEPSLESTQPEEEDKKLSADELDDISAELEKVRSEQDDSDESEGEKAGLFSSMVGMFKRKSGKGEADDEDILNVESDEAPVSEAQPEEPKEAVMPKTKPVAMKPISPSQAMAVKAEPEGHKPPSQLDDKTQLVSLAPVDGGSHFNQLLDSYRNLPEGTMPKQVSVAAQMANVDYLSLIGEACNKNLDAFSKLLGLHKIMADAGCDEWVSDMDLLRKGYGDAVLATVVSKYSPEECREILNCVYQPKPRTAAAG